jgi:hypothetical protein
VDVPLETMLPAEVVRNVIRPRIVVLGLPEKTLTASLRQSRVRKNVLRMFVSFSTAFSLPASGLAT